MNKQFEVADYKQMAVERLRQSITEKFECTIGEIKEADYRCIAKWTEILLSEIAYRRDLIYEFNKETEAEEALIKAFNYIYGLVKGAKELI